MHQWFSPSERPIEFDFTNENEFEIGHFFYPYVVFPLVSTTMACYQTLTMHHPNPFA